MHHARAMNGTGQPTELARLHAALTLIEGLAGIDAGPGVAARAEQERIARDAYGAVPSLIRRRYDAMAGETAAFAAAGLAALLRQKDGGGDAPSPAAARLAAEMRAAIAELERLIGA